jgi:pseudaminic acid biosynthesis-associated methylase
VGYAKSRFEDLTILQGSGFEIPFKTEIFDLVFTSGVLIHIAPPDLPIVMREIYRCSSQYIWGLEYYAESMVEVRYRGNTGVLWKGDFASIFLRSFPDLTLIKKRFYPYVNDHERGNLDCMYLLKKGA